MRLDSKPRGVTNVNRDHKGVSLVLILKVHAGSDVVVEEYAIIYATAVEDFMELFWEVHLTLANAWKDIKDSDAAKEWAFKIEKWTMKLEEDGKVAGTSTTPMTMTEKDLEAETGAEAYKEWYDRNVLGGKQIAYRVSFDVVLEKK